MGIDASHAQDKASGSSSLAVQELAGAFESPTHSQQVRRARSYAARKHLDDSGRECMQRSGDGVGSEELGMWSPEMDGCVSPVLRVLVRWCEVGSC